MNWLPMAARMFPSLTTHVSCVPLGTPFTLTAFGTVPDSNVVGWPRFPGALRNVFERPTGTICSVRLSFVYP
jgi:hypothetical protein